MEQKACSKSCLSIQSGQVLLLKAIAGKGKANLVLSKVMAGKGKAKAKVGERQRLKAGMGGGRVGWKSILAGIPSYQLSIHEAMKRWMAMWGRWWVVEAAKLDILGRRER